MSDTNGLSSCADDQYIHRPFPILYFPYSALRNQQTRDIGNEKLQSEHPEEQFIIDIDRTGNIVEHQSKKDENRPDQHGNECWEKLGKARLPKRLVVVSRKIVKHQPEKRDDYLTGKHARILQIVKQAICSFIDGEHLITKDIE